MAENVDRDQIFEGICRTAALKVGISVERAKSILEKAGLHSHDNVEIEQALNVILTQVDPSATLLEGE